MGTPDCVSKFFFSRVAGNILSPPPPCTPFCRRAELQIRPVLDMLDENETLRGVRTTSQA